MSKEEIFSAAKEKGSNLFPEDFENQIDELSDDDLDVVAGGGRCICSFGGGEKTSEGEKTCACVMGGGEYKDGSVRCVCIIGGDGN